MKLAKMIPARELQKGPDLVVITFPDRPRARGRVVMIEHTPEGTVHVCLEGGQLFGLQGHSMVGLVPRRPASLPASSPRHAPRGPDGDGGKVISLRRHR